MPFVYDYVVEVRERGKLLRSFVIENMPDGATAIECAEAKIMAWNKDIELQRFFIVDKKKDGEVILNEVLWTGLEFFAKRQTALDGRDLAMA